MHAVRRSPFILSHRFPLVKNFFRVFSNFFKLSHPHGTDSIFNQAVELGRRSRSDLHTISLTFQFVKHFFQIFQIFFQVLTLRRRSRMPLSQALGYSSKAKWKCQALFSTFFASFFILWLALKILCLSSCVTQDMLSIFPLSPQ